MKSILFKFILNFSALILFISCASLRNSNLSTSKTIQANINLNQEVLKQINTFGIDLTKSSLHLRTAYRQSAVLGRTVFDIPGADKACTEIKMLKEEVIKILSI